MKLLDFVVPEAIVADLKARTKEEAIPEIIDALVASGAITEEQREEFIALIRDREKRATTGLGHGVATPHAKHTDIKQIKAAVAVSHHGVEFNALDRQPVFTVFLLLSPAERPEDHLDAMQVIFDNLNQERFRRFLRQARTRDEIVTLLTEADEKQPVR